MIKFVVSSTIDSVTFVRRDQHVLFDYATRIEHVETPFEELRTFSTFVTQRSILTSAGQPRWQPQLPTTKTSSFSCFPLSVTQLEFFVSPAGLSYCD